MIPVTFPTISDDFVYDDSPDDFSRTVGLSADNYVGDTDFGGYNFVGLLTDEEMIALSLVDAIYNSRTVTGFASTREEHYEPWTWNPIGAGDFGTVYVIDAWTSSGFHTLETYGTEEDYAAAVESYEEWASDLERSTYRVRYEEVGGWTQDLGTVRAYDVADALDIVEERYVTTEYRTNQVGDVWTWNGTDYISSSDAHESDGFGYIDLHEMREGDEDLGEPDYTWTVSLVQD